MKHFKVHNSEHSSIVTFLLGQFNGMHAFMRDEGYRYDPQLEMFTLQYAISMFQRKLHEGDRVAAAPLEKGALNAKM